MSDYSQLIDSFFDSLIRIIRHPTTAVIVLAAYAAWLFVKVHLLEILVRELDGQVHEDQTNQLDCDGG